MLIVVTVNAGRYTDLNARKGLAHVCTYVRELRKALGNISERRKEINDMGPLLMGVVVASFCLLNQNEYDDRNFEYGCPDGCQERRILL